MTAIAIWYLPIVVSITGASICWYLGQIGRIVERIELMLIEAAIAPTSKPVEGRGE